MRISALLLTVALLLTACGDDTTAETAASGDDDRSAVEAVAVEMVTSFLNSDHDALRELILPDQRGEVDDIELAAAQSPRPEVEIVSISATVVSTSGDTAIVDYSGEYCLPESSTDVPVTIAEAEGSETDTVPGAGIAVEETEQCFLLDEIFETDEVEFRRIDGEWFAPLPE